MLNALKSNVVVDKSYLQAVSKAKITELASAHGLLMTEGMLYELMKGTDVDRAGWFYKFPDAARPFELIPSPGVLMRHELQNNVACGLPSKHVRNIDHSSTALYRDPSYSIPADLIKAREGKRDEIDEDTDLMLSLIDSIPTLFPEFEHAHEKHYIALRLKAQDKICTDVDFVRSGAMFLVKQSPFFSSANVARIDHEWITFRWLQVALLFVLDLKVRYPGGIASVMTPRLRESIRHDVLDAQYLMMALLEGAFATKEKKLCEWWMKLKPDGLLYS
ncbi:MULTISPECIES: hypothetical protein [Pseudomonas]|jgi:hypothetical protein|nr:MULTISPECIES: hypothetical protein [Pseudomonas]EPJ82401.1 hypothetical protein CFT9_16012 [Pseudomonas sp. CFT9]OKP74657.1 hypothetical protein BTR19_00060 [Pseudomonas fluorescens]